MNPFNQIPLGKVLGATHSLLVRSLARKLREAEIPLTPDQYRIMAILWEEEGGNQCNLAEKVQRDRTTITRILDTLERDELIERRVDPNDRRQFRIFLTPKGNSLKQPARACAKAVNDEALGQLTEEEAAFGFRFLNYIIKNLNQKTQSNP